MFADSACQKVAAGRGHVQVDHRHQLRCGDPRIPACHHVFDHSSGQRDRQEGLVWIRTRQHLPDGRSVQQPVCRDHRPSHDPGPAVRIRLTNWTDVQAGPQPQPQAPVACSQRPVPLSQHILQCVEEPSHYGGKMPSIEPNPQPVAAVVRKQRLSPHPVQPGPLKCLGNDVGNGLGKELLIRIGVAAEPLGIDHQHRPVRRQVGSLVGHGAPHLNHRTEWPFPRWTVGPYGIRIGVEEPMRTACHGCCYGACDAAVPEWVHRPGVRRIPRARASSKNCTTFCGPSPACRSCAKSGRLTK